ncbi:hypothetical protein [Brunnivagina elsteri]|uniref:hypothetical protein n=1 Tax=Brunnivagina elsteri TaxID=1247191 RepID=UPI001B80A0FD|nr:hypothetical protein [Calothrix elsteri]
MCMIYCDRITTMHHQSVRQSINLSILIKYPEYSHPEFTNNYLPVIQESPMTNITEFKYSNIQLWEPAKV